jgi:hypothetical protein
MAFWDTPVQQAPTPPAMPPAPSMRGTERRRAFRRVVMRDGVLTPTDYANVPGCLRAVVIDMTSFGVGLRIRENLEPGSVYTLTIPDLPDVNQSRIRVIESRPCKGEQYQVGAEFC